VNNSVNTLQITSWQLSIYFDSFGVMTHYDVSHNTQWWTYAQSLTISVKSFITVYAIIAKSIRSTHGHYEDNLQIILATWEWDKLLNRRSNIQQIDTTIVGSKDTGPQFLVRLFPLLHSINHPRHMQKGPQLISPFRIQSYAQPHSVQSCRTRRWSVYGFTMYQLVATLMSLGEITTEHKRSRY